MFKPEIEFQPQLVRSSEDDVGYVVTSIVKRGTHVIKDKPVLVGFEQKH